MITTRTVRRIGDDPRAQILLDRLQRDGFKKLSDLRIETVYRFEGIGPKEADALRTLLCHPTAETFSEASQFDRSGPVFEVGYQRAVTDPELPSILRAAHAMGISNLIWVRISHRYQFAGIDQETAKSIVNRYLFNPQVQVLIQPDEVWDTLRPRGQKRPVETIALRGRSPESLEILSTERRLFLNREQMVALQHVEERMGRSLTDAELEMFAQTWSDHCFHTTWKSLGLLQKLTEATFRIQHPLVLSVFEDNAGAIRFYDNWALTIKGETHNSPTAVSPYGGIMTKHGGVIRDTLGCGQGAKPVGGSTIMGLGDPKMDWRKVPKGVLHPRAILVDAIRGTADYCNPMGIPMMFPVYKFHPGYTGKCFALGHSVGIIPADRARKGRPECGDLVLLIGGLTGRDGLHGATVSSGSMTSETAVVDAAHVQIGQPIEERKFMEAIPVLRDADCIRAVTDLGAAGLSSAAGEMGADTGIWINLAWVPLKTEGMCGWEIWISESQERMLLCVPPEKGQQTLDLLKRYEVPASIIGRFTDTNRCQVVFDPSDSLNPRCLPRRPPLSGEMVVDLDFKELRKGCPLPKLELKSPRRSGKSAVLPEYTTLESWRKSIHDVLGHLNCCDQSEAGLQFDNTIQGNTAVGPYGERNMPNDVWVSTPVSCKPYGAVCSIGFNPLYGDVDPAGMSGLMMVEAITKLVAAGVSPSDIVLCDNFYTPKINPEVGCTLKSMVETVCELSVAFGTPFISGKDSSSGTFIREDGKRMDIPPTLAVMAMGRVPDVRKLVPKSWRSCGSVLLLAGSFSSELGGSVFLDTLGQRGAGLPQIQPALLKTFWENLNRLISQNRICSASAIADGGLIRRLFEMSLGSGLGCRVDLEPLRKRLNAPKVLAGLFAEMIGCVLLEVREPDVARVEQALGAQILGTVTETFTLEIASKSRNLNLPMTELISVWEKPFQEIAR